MPAPRFTVEREDGSVKESTLSPKWQIAYERDTGEPLFEESERVRVEKVYRLGWYAEGKPGDFDEWLDDVESVSMVNDEDEDDDSDARPTSPERSLD